MLPSNPTKLGKFGSEIVCAWESAQRFLSALVIFDPRWSATKHIASNWERIRARRFQAKHKLGPHTERDSHRCDLMKSTAPTVRFLIADLKKKEEVLRIVHTPHEVFLQDLVVGKKKKRYFCRLKRARLDKKTYI